MELQSISRQSLGVTQLVRAQVSNGRIALPVSNNRIYANFKHIKGTGGSGNLPSFSLSQLRNLDNLIDRLKLLKSKNIEAVNLENSTPDDITKMIEQYREELFTELRKNSPYQASVSTSGLSVDVFA